MAETTMEEAMRCPKCGNTGEETASNKRRVSRQLVIIKTITCRAELCPWFGTGWFIQINEDGSIPAAYSGVNNSSKQFPKISQETATKIQENILDQISMETSSGGAEIRNPNT